MFASYPARYKGFFFFGPGGASGSGGNRQVMFRMRLGF